MIIYYLFILHFIIINYLVFILLIIMIFKIKNKKLNILWPISILKYYLPFFSYTFFGQSFFLLSTVYNCNDGYILGSDIVKCMNGFYYKILLTLTGIALFFQSLIAMLTNFLYFKPIFYKSDSDLLKKTNSSPDIVFVITKIGMNLLFILKEDKESQQWFVLFASILFSGINTYFYLYYKNRINKILCILNDFFSLTLFSAFLSLFVGKMFTRLEFTGSLYLFFICIIIIFIYIFFYKNSDINCISIDYKEISNPNDYLHYVVEFYNIIENKENSRNYYTILESLISKIEENCIISDCPLTKYNENMKNGIESPFLLIQFGEKLFEYGISKFPEDINLKINYAIILTRNMHYKNKALMILNSIDRKKITFEKSYSIFKALKLIEKWNFSIKEKKNIVFEYKKNIQDFKSLIKNLSFLYYEFLSLLLNSKYQNNDSFNKIHKIGREIMKINPKIDEDYNNLINIQTDNIEIIKLYSEFVEGVLCDEEKTEKCQNDSKIRFISKIEIHEKDFVNFDIDILKQKVNLPYIIVSAHKDQLGNIVDLSMNVLKIFGYSRDELIGKNINILIPKLFHKIHEFIFFEHYQNDKLKLFDELNKRIIYFPNFFKKEVYGLSKMTFLIELNINVYFVKTEKNRIVYIVEIENFNPLEIDLIKNTSNYPKYCILTDENFIIQYYTPNCVDFLKFTGKEINSNYSIINHIKQFKDDYLTAINNIELSKYSHINKAESNPEDKFCKQKSFKSNNQPNIKKKTINDLFIKKYSKKCKITWIFFNEINISSPSIKKHKKLFSKNTDINSDFSKSNIMNSNKKKDINNKDSDLNLYLEIQKIIIKNKLFGYYFYFSKITNKTPNNMSYQFEKDEINDSNNYLTKLKKYQCKFRKKIDTNDVILNKLKNENNKNIFSSLIIRPSKQKDIEKKEINNLRKKERKKSLDKNTKVVFKKVDDNNPINNCYYTNEYFSDDDDSVITGEFIPSYTSHFTIDLKNMYFIQINKNYTQLEYLEILKKEANDKINAYKEQFELISKTAENSNESEEFESNDTSYLNSNFSDDNSLSNSKSNITNRKNNNKVQSFIHKKKTKKDSQNNNENNNDVNMSNAATNITKKLQNKNNILNNFYKVKLDKIHYMIFDFNKDMLVDGDKGEIVSKIEQIMTETKNKEANYLEKEEIFCFIKSFINKNKKNPKETKDIKKIVDINISQTNKIDEEKLFKKKIHEALNKHKDEEPIIKLKIFIFLSYLILITCGIIILANNLSYLSRTSNSLFLFKSILFIRYCSQISVYYVREMTLLSFKVKKIQGGKYINYPAKEKEEYITLIKQQLMELFIENQSFMKAIFSSPLTYSKNSSQILSESHLNIKMLDNPKIEMEYNILTALVQYNSAFYNLASSTTNINQNHTDLPNYIYNNLNEYKIAFNILIDIFQDELKRCLVSIIIIVIIVAIIILISLIIIYILIIKNFLSSIRTRGNYMKVFYGINENILKNLIDNCENLIRKLKSSEEQRYYEEENLNESNEEKINLEENKKKQNLYQNNNLTNDIENKDKTKASSKGLIFIIIYGIFAIISYLYFLYNAYYLINKISDSISISYFCLNQNNYHIKIIEFFNIYREFLFDNQTILHNISSNLYLEQFEEFLENNIEDLDSYNNQFLTNNELQKEKSLCCYYINDFYDSSAECEEKIGLISTYDFKTFIFSFIEDIKIGKDLVKYKLEYERIVGNLTEYNYLDYINITSLPENSSESESDYEIIFRLDLFNNESLHFDLNIKFFIVILPYIQENRQRIYTILTIGKASKHMTIFFLVFISIVTLIYLCYFLPTINSLNKIIYKTKNMLSIIPLNILASQNGVSKLLNISNEK